MTSPRARRRLFVALEVTGEAAIEIDGIRRAIGSSSLGRIAPHLTLVAPVNVAEQHLDEALAVLRANASEDPIPVALGPPRALRAKSPVLYLEVRGTSARLAQLQRALDLPPLAAPTSRPKRPFLAHVTLSSRMEKAEMPTVLAALAHFRVETVLSRLTLYEQHHDEARHPWYPLADVLLGAGSAATRGGRAVSFVVSRVPGPDVPDAVAAASPVAGGETVAVIGREGRDLVAEAFGRLVGGQFVVERWCVERARRGEGFGHALVRAVERAGAAVGSERVVIAAPSPEQSAFLSHVGLVAADGLVAGRPLAWFVPVDAGGERPPPGKRP